MFHGLVLKLGYFIGTIIILIYINDLSDDLARNVKFFADDSSLFSIAHKMNGSTINSVENDF